MKKEVAKRALHSFTILFVFILTFGFVLAAHTVNDGDTGTTIFDSVNEDVAYLYNVSINNTDSGSAANISEVNITMPTGFSFVFGSNNTDAGTHTFSNTSSVISWQVDELVNGTDTNYFWFNASAATPGTYNFIVSTLNTSGAFTNNLSITVNDTTNPSAITFVSPTQGNYANISNSEIIVNLTASDNGVIDSILVRLYNSSNDLINSSISSTSPLYVNFSGLSDGTYIYNATVNDTFNNELDSSTRTITLDTVYPMIDFGVGTLPNASTSYSTEIYVNVSLVELNEANITFRLFNTTGLVNSTTYTNNNRVINWSGLAYGVYRYNVTGEDYSGLTETTDTYFITLSADPTWEFNGTVTDLDGNFLNNSIINFTIVNASNMMSVLSYQTTTTNESGWFNISVPNQTYQDQYLYSLSVSHLNETFGHVDYIGQSIPYMPQEVFTRVAASGINFYLRDAGTMNITAVNASGDRVPFNYQVKDKKLGYAVAEAFDQNAMVMEAIVSLPNDRNYSIMVYPNQSMPGSADWSNFTSTSSYTDGLLSYNATTSTLTKTMNLTMGYARVYGYVNLSGPGFNVAGYDEFTIVTYLMEPGDMTHYQYGSIPFNLSSFFDQGSPSDVYNYTTGYYNISLPSTVEDSSMLLFAAARNGSGYYGGFHNLSLSFSEFPGNGTNTELNFSYMFGMLGDPANLTVQGTSGGNRNVPTRLQSFNLVNSSNDSLSNIFAHGEIDVSYSDYGVRDFTWMVDVNQGESAVLNVPLLNVTGFEEMNLYVSGGGDQQYAPKSITMTAAEIIANNNITINVFDPQAIGSNESAIQMGMLISNSTCDVPDPDDGCYLSVASPDFDPFAAVLGGGRLSFTMGTDDVTIIYINTDLLASGPPDALFEDSSGITDEGGSGFNAAMQFGSDGPKIFDYALIGVTYSETSGSGLDDSEEVNVSIGILYNDNGDVIWNITTNGTSGDALGANYSHYFDRRDEWEILMNGTTCHTDQSGVNSSDPCYINTTDNQIWIRVPHFSQVGPTISGSVVQTSSSSSSSSGSTSSGGGGGSSTDSDWTNTFVHDDKEFSEIDELDKELRAKQRVRIQVDGEDHHVGVKSMTEDEATIEVRSDPQEATLKIGESEKFDVNEDDYYDLLVTLKGISSQKADITIEYLNEKIVEEAEVEAETTQETTTEEAETTEIVEESTESSGLWWVIISFVIIAVVIVMIVFKHAQKKKEEAGLIIPKKTLRKTRKNKRRK